MLNPRQSAGFNLVELLIGISIAAFLLTLAAPYYTDFLVNTQIRTVAESISDGLRQTQTQAIKRNENMQFVLDPAVGWAIQDVATATDVQRYAFIAGGDKVTVTVIWPTAAERTVTFNGLGRIVNPNPGDATAPLEWVQVTSTSIAQPRNMRVLSGFNSTPAIAARNTGIRMCNESLPAADPQGCPL